MVRCVITGLRQQMQEHVFEIAAAQDFVRTDQTPFLSDP